MVLSRPMYKSQLKASSVVKVAIFKGMTDQRMNISYR